LENAAMRFRTLILVSCLISTGPLYPMQYAGSIDPQVQSLFHRVPWEIMPKILWSDWNTIRTVYALQRTCRLSHTMKRRIASALLDTAEGEHNECFQEALQVVPLPLAYGILSGKACVAPLLYLLAGVDVNYANKYDEQPALSIVMTTPDADEFLISYLPILIKAGANINQQDKYGNTPLHYAAIYNVLHGVELLLMHGADKTKLNKTGCLPIDCCAWIAIPGRQIKEELKASRIKAMLQGVLRPQDSIAEPIPERNTPNAIDALNSYFDDSQDSDDSSEEFRDFCGISVLVKKQRNNY